MTDSEVTRALTTVQKTATDPAVTTTVGPFSVFQTQSASTRDIDHSSSQNPGDTAMDGSEETNQRTINNPIIPMVDSPYQTTSELPQFLESTVDTTVPPSDVCVGGDQAETPIGALATESPDDAPVVNTRTSTTTSLSHQPDYLCPTSHGLATTSRGVDVTVSQSPGWMERNDDSPRESAPEDLGVILFENDLALTIMEDTTAAMLMHHYMQHVVHLMQPVSHPRNPWKTVYLPLALHGSSQLDLPKSWNQLHPASVAVFHGVLSVAAVNLQSMEADQEALERLACHHKQLALVALQSTLATKSTPYKDIMAAILSLVSADIMDGGMSDHWIHLEAGIKLQASRHYAMLVSHETCLLNNICKMLHLFGQTTLPHRTPKPWPGYDYVPRGADFYSLEPSIEFLYGITISIAGAIFRIYRLSQYVAYYRSQGQEYPETLLEACETLADDLGSYTITSELFSTIDSSEAEAYMVDIARAQAKAFHNAALIYYYRSIQECARSCLHREQQAVLAAMNEAEDLKVSFGKHTSFPAPITWPAFVASCEAVGEERRSWDKWWRRLEVYGMRNYHRQYATVRSIWGKLGEDETRDWREVLDTVGLRILPV
ncbi:hypothetical protein PENFLA_c018G04368 [Penicillium flavigenum]|uniref:Transcription factor domain-containing protein n=1 Tax=Penicillium flavigenum TaxID=254877 RepID=A0A1V6T074_9EURO|nr:hypothetical protein PENFLA_c018G04368 [Penicillium flavigenum]